MRLKPIQYNIFQKCRAKPGKVNHPDTFLNRGSMTGHAKGSKTYTTYNKLPLTRHLGTAKDFTVNIDVGSFMCIV